MRYTVIPELDLVGAYYGYKQNAYGTGANAGCSTNKSGTCSGTEDVISFDADYRLTKRFDGFVGVMYSGVKDGLARRFRFQHDRHHHDDGRALQVLTAKNAFDLMARWP